MKKILINIVLVIIIFVSGCEFFVTREPEKPDQIRANFLPPTEPKIVIVNLKNSFTDKNVQNYIACFVDTLFTSKKFNFLPSSEAAAKFAFLNQDWDINSERKYFSSVVSKIPKNFPLTLNLTDENYSSVAGDTLIYTASYFINIQHNFNEPKNYAGNLQFNMVRDNRSQWVIYFWRDTKSSNLPSWSELKGYFY